MSERRIFCLSSSGKPYPRRKLSKYMRKKLSERMKAKWQDKDYREKIKAAKKTSK